LESCGVITMSSYLFLFFWILNRLFWSIHYNLIQICPTHLFCHPKFLLTLSHYDNLKDLNLPLCVMVTNILQFLEFCFCSWVLPWWYTIDTTESKYSLGSILFYWFLSGKIFKNEKDTHFIVEGLQSMICIYR
jgi:hypothetical protein